jgi:NAD(P)-dependent dehydrogenase (short-subunit alcohol dehydrogenase family)
MMTKGGLNTVTRGLAIEYGADGIRFNAVAPGPVQTPMHKDDPAEAYTSKQALKTVTQVNDIVDAVLYLARANQVTGEIIHVDGGSHAGR